MSNEDDVRLKQWFEENPSHPLTRSVKHLFEAGRVTAYFVPGCTLPVLLYKQRARATTAK